jgi:hypothetical protein
VTHTFSPETERRLEQWACAALVAAAVAAVVVIFPPEGWLLAPLHQWLEALLGGAAVLLPLGLALTAALCLVRRARPNLALPRKRFVGLALLALAVLIGDRLLGASTGVIGEWLTTFLVEAVGAPLTVALVISVVCAGAVLTFDFRKLIVAAR